MQRKSFGDRGCRSGHKSCAADQIFCFHQIIGKNWEYSETAHQLFVDLKKACDSVWRKVLCNILIDFGNPMKLVMLINVCLNETCSRVRVGKHLCDTLPV
jgi:hypothetical protein